MENTKLSLAEQYNDTLCEAIDTIVKARLSELSFDKTITCTITDISKSAQGEYTVTDGSISFQAFGEYTNYTENTQVQVLIPNGDWTAQKRIVGRYSSDTDNKPIAYVAPTAQVARLADVGVIIPNNALGLTANLSEENLWTKIVNNKIVSQPFAKDIEVILPSEVNLNTEIYNTLCVRGKFKTLFDSFNVQSGVYGLLIRLSAKDPNGQVTTLDFNFSSNSDMFGRVYNFSDWVLQEQVYTINESIGIINNIEVAFYQNGEFITSSNEVIGFDENLNRESAPKNIWLSELEIFFGANMAVVTDNTVKIYTNNSVEYSPDTDSIDKTVSLIWYNKGEGNKFLGFEDGKFNKAYAMLGNVYTEEDIKQPDMKARNEEIKEQFLEKEGLSSADELNEQQRDKLNELYIKPGDEIYPPETDTDNYYWIEWYADDISGAKQLIAEGEWKDVSSISVQCIPEITETEVYAKVWLNKESFTSNTLTFKNHTDKTRLVLGEHITISLKNADTDTKDIYPIYGEDNLAIGSQAAKKRTVEMEWRWSRGVIQQDFWVGATITWSIPKANTLLRPLYGQNTTQSNSIDEEDVYQFNENGSLIIDENNKPLLQETKSKKFSFSYRLENAYNPMCNNNTIICTLKKDDIELTVTKNITLTTQGTTGTDYTLVVAPEDDRYYGFVKEEALIEDFQATLIDLNGNVINATIELTPSQANGKFAPVGYNIITATAKNVPWAGRKVDLTTKYPVIYSQDDKYDASVPIKIIYDSFGSLTQTIKNGAPLELYDSQGNILSAQWDIVYPNGNAQQRLPTLSKPDGDQITKYSLIPASVYISGEDTAYLKAIYGNKVVWTSPLIIEQYKYGSEVLNDWDGQTIIDKDNNRVLTNAFAAGYMGADNAFNGVILGEVGNIDSETPAKKTGLYGYQNGVQTYGFKGDGTAFIGDSGAGRISFNGSEGIIASGAWIKNNGDIRDTLESGKSGLLINLQTGELKSKNFSISSTGNATFNGKITSSSGRIGGWEIGSQSLIHGKLGKPGSFWLHAGSGSSTTSTADGYGKTSIGGTPTPVGNWHLTIGENFGVRTGDSGSELWCNNANITGKITATQLTLSNTTIPTKYIDGLAAVATSGSYTDLIDKDKILTQEDQYTYETTTIVKNNMSIAQTTVKDKTGKVISKTYTAPDGQYVYTNVGYGDKANSNTSYVAISSAGLLEANNAIIHGTIYANSGRIGGWNMFNDGVLMSYYDTTPANWSGNKKHYHGVGINPTQNNFADNGIVFAIGPLGTYNSAIAAGKYPTNWNNASFRVTADGELTATKATIVGDITANSGSFTGKITSSSGRIGGWQIGSTSMIYGKLGDPTAFWLHAGSGSSITSTAPGYGKTSIGGSDLVGRWHLVIGKNFGVRTTSDGGSSELYCDSGKIGGWKILKEAGLHYSDPNSETGASSYNGPALRGEYGGTVTYLAPHGVFCIPPGETGLRWIPWYQIKLNY